MSRPVRRSRGFSLVELLVALTIGGLLITGTVFIYSQSRNTFTLNESQARLQEDARYVLSVIEPEIQLAGYFGFSNQGGNISFFDAGTLTHVSALRQDDAEFATVPAALHSCGTNWALDLFMSVQGAENTYDWAPAGANCAASGGGAVADTDTLTIRRVAVATSAPTSTRIQFYTNRLAPNENYLFRANAAPGPITANVTEVRNLVVQGYYISQNSVGIAGLPALRRKSLVAGPAWLDEEIMRGVEDLQVQFGVDIGDDLDGDGNPDDPDNDGVVDYVDGHATRYVDPDDPILTSAQVVSVRIWLRVRALEPEQGYVNNNQYVYGSTDFTANDNFRRVVVSRTVLLRNARLFTEVET
ncbi:MAG: PilW family protein [Steroidobacteraceae bacterium]